QSEAILGMTDAPRKDEIDRCREEVAVLEEERPLLGKEHLEALVDGDLRLVRLDLAEIGIDRRIQHKTPMQDELAVESDFRLEPATLEEWIVGIALIDVAITAEQAVWNQLHIARG